MVIVVIGWFWLKYRFDDFVMSQNPVVWHVVWFYFVPDGTHFFLVHFTHRSIGGLFSVVPAGLGFMLRFDSFEQHRRRFVVGVMGDEFAGEGEGAEGWRELVHLPAPLGQPQLKVVGRRDVALLTKNRKSIQEACSHAIIF